jgi:hypothetical protein
MPLLITIGYIFIYYAYLNSSWCACICCSHSQATILNPDCHCVCACHFHAEIWKKNKSNLIFDYFSLLKRLVLPCIPNAKLANGLGFHSHVFEFGLQILQPPFGEFLLVQWFNFYAAIHNWIMTEIAQLLSPRRRHFWTTPSSMLAGALPDADCGTVCCERDAKSSPHFFTSTLGRNVNGVHFFVSTGTFF